MSLNVKPQPPSVIKPQRFSRADNAFLPAALDIIETPLSPVRYVLVLTICGFVSIAVAWSYIGRIDIIAVAQGKVQVVGRTKTIEPPQAGKVRALHVQNGDEVKAGDVLVNLDDSDTRADEAMLEAALQSAKAEVVRRTVALARASQQKPDVVPAIAWPADAAPDVIAREQRVLDADLTQLASTVESLESHRQEKLAERTRIEATITAQAELVATLKERVDMRATLLDKAAGSKSSLIDASETYLYHGTNLAAYRGQLGEIDANLRSVQADVDKTTATFIADNAEKLAAAEREIENKTQDLVKARIKTAADVVTSPINGVVQGLMVTTIGQVVTAGEQILQVVPRNGSVEIEAYLANGDIGFVKPGQVAVVKVEAFPFVTYGTIDAHVSRVGFDAIPLDEAAEREGNPALRGRNTTFGGVQRTQNLVYPVTLTLDRATIAVDGLPVPLAPGMAVTVEIKTGRRRILEYVFSPLVQVGSTALKER